MITLVNYETYNPVKENDNQQSTRSPTINQPATNQQLTTTKNVKNDKNVKNIKKNTKKKACPTQAECIKYAREEGLSVNPIEFFKFFTTGDDKSQHWIDSKGKPVYNWKQKMRTWGNFNDNRQGIGKGTQKERGKEAFKESDNKDYGTVIEV